MTDFKFVPSELTKEKKLWDIYIASRKIPSSIFNTLTTLLVFIILIVNSWLTTQPIDEMISMTRDLSSTGLAVTLSTLGFLLAGFTIFATISQPSLSIAMAGIEHPKSGLSYLKHNYFIFLRVFIYYLVFAVFCLIIIMFGHKGGLLSLLIEHSACPSGLKVMIVKASYIMILTGYYFLIMQLKSFVFNIYHSVMTSLRWKAEGND